MRGRVRVALAAGVLLATVGSGVCLALPVAAVGRVAASRAAALSRMPDEPLSPKMRLVERQLTEELTTGRASRAADAAPQLASSAPCTPTFSAVFCAVASPNASAGRNVLTGLAAIAPNDTWAVGFYVNGSSVYQTLAEHWDGSAWSMVATPNVGPGNNLFTAVTAIGPGDVWAVGYYRPGTSGLAQPLTEHWNGNGWTVFPAYGGVNPSTLLFSVSGDASDDVWAVGMSIDSSAPFGPRGDGWTIHWNGSSWSLGQGPIPHFGSGFGVMDVASLNGVKVLAANDVWFVGDAQNYTASGPSSPDTAFVFHWDGGWTQIPVPAHPSGDFLIDVQGSANDLWAVGGQVVSATMDKVVTEHWNGTSWSDVTGASAGLSSDLFALGYINSTNVYAVGAAARNMPKTSQERDDTLIERWNGSSWSQVLAANPTDSQVLVAIAAISANDIWAAGAMLVNGYDHTLTENFSAPPAVTNIAPSSGNPGSTVVITGTGFSRAIDVEFGATPAFTFHVDSDTQVTATSPGHKAGIVDIRVTVQGTSAISSADHFTYLASRSGGAGGSGMPFSGVRTTAPPPVPSAPPHPRGISRSAPIPI